MKTKVNSQKKKISAISPSDRVTSFPVNSNGAGGEDGHPGPEIKAPQYEKVKEIEI